MRQTNLDGKTLDITQENIKKLKELFPEIITEDQIDFDKLKKLLGDNAKEEKERYNFTWNGKGDSLRLSQTPSLGTLRPCKDESVDWEETQNLYIEGDNLEVLKLLQKSYYGKIKMIYIDPPYNTGKDFVYSDDYKDNLKNYMQITGQADEEGKKISTNTETSGRYHTNWLNMMYPRLRLARNLLSDDGVIFISIDDNECANLKKICDEIFGEDNFVAQMVRRNKSGAGHDSKYLAIEYEYCIAYCKNLFFLELNKEVVDTENDPKYSLMDEHVNRRGRYYLRSLKYKGSYSKSLDYPITLPNGTIVWPGDVEGPPHTWRWSEEKYYWGLEHDFIVFSNNQVFIKQYQLVDNNDQLVERQIPYRAYMEFLNGEATQETNRLIGDIFSYPKPTSMIKYLLRISSNRSCTILDFFSGSATTGDAVMQLNAEDGGNRKYIMVQLPEPTEEASEAFRQGYKNISDIGKERLRRAGKKILDDNAILAVGLDIGFKVFKLDTSNIKKWNPSHDNIEDSIMDSVNNFLEGREHLDIVYEIILKYGLDLTYPVLEYDIEGKKVYSIGEGMLMICLEDEITTELATGILNKVKELSPESTRIVIKDNGFKSDSDKTNVKEILKNGGIDEFITL